jgi:hypothetical protein
MHLAGSASSGRILTWSGDGAAHAAGKTPRVDSWSGRLSIGRAGHPFGELLVSKSVRESPLPSEIPDLMDRLRREAAERLEALAEAAEGRPGVKRPTPIQAEAA